MATNFAKFSVRLEGKGIRNKNWEKDFGVKKNLTVVLLYGMLERVVKDAVVI